MTTPRDPDAHTRADRELPPGRHPETWQDRDGRLYVGDGPYQHRWTRRLRRALRPYSTRWIR